MKIHFVNNPEKDYEVPGLPNWKDWEPKSEEDCALCECCGENIERGGKIDDEPVFEYHGLNYCDACRNFIKKDEEGKVEWHKGKPAEINYIGYIIKIKRGEDGCYYKLTDDYKDGTFWYECDDNSFHINLDDENFLGWIGFDY